MHNEFTPMPGSDDAAIAGCICSRIENRYGRGLYTGNNGKAVYKINAQCNLHKITTEKDESSYPVQPQSL